MFTPDGELRPDFQPEEAPSQAATPAPAPDPRPAGAAAEADRRPEPVSEGKPEQQASESRGAFALIVQILAMPAYAALGLVPDPASGRGRIDRAAAQEMIDLLAVLERKTHGNLSFEESTFLSRVLTELRLAFVEATRPPAQ